MSLDKHFNDVLNKLLSNQDIISISNAQLMHCIDLTLLEADASLEALHQLQSQACQNNVAAICVLPKHLHVFKPNSKIKLATVINFPLGNDDLLVSLEEIDNAIQLGANEIDYVLPYQYYLRGNKQKALNHCDVIIQTCKKHQLTLKIILETGLFPDMESVYQLSSEIIALGGRFLKTSTGKTPQGATLAAIFAIVSAVMDSTYTSSCGIKVSGGIKTPLQAQQYAQLAELLMGKAIHRDWFRIGASTLLEKLLS
ncbi:TPA: deoxyribose-phosphate aldolase [Legionella pneumophila subsp. pneumophila]|uniref:Deoxyribose-phosphate aldolase n=1 Tax=Legionella pneumophila (strain Lens) TaxID=297245 RepID=Q5WW52_LEGPL|nr:deoxyribose-phosphate aldolase [Legionella pneumophila]AOW51817.1 deoxyribose-phosphate aldolase [Legionella pneumophila subsp. pneumophila]AOW54587.1 deoxyribose-phosphate aldolase [Legionella pneumophila subsp. pneumophila]AOW62611.1 deoxyribose-phosphate aldolase [Legionella pneumophila subsp. pneumophila]RYW86314.1 deoxyribose-phosphate aldolase [Legionella pneumophila]RYW92582.1 deoxyribose-phosphate aldolase [Legionella pneumophila]